MILAAGVVLGLVSYFRMPVNLFPDVEFPVIIVTTVYPGASPEEVEDQVTSVLEEQLGGIAGLDQLSSQSGEGVSTVIMEFDLDMDVDKVSQQVREEVGLLRRSLPDGIEEPLVGRFNFTDTPIILFGIADKTGSLSPAELRVLVEEEFQAPLERVDGVGQVLVEGGDVREVQVLLDMAALQARRIAPQQVIDAIRVENTNIPGGSLVDGQLELLVRTPGNFDSLEDIEDVIVTNRGASIYVRDVATVVDTFEKRDKITRLNGEESIVVSVRKESGTNTTEVADDVKSVLDDIAAENPGLDVAIAGDESDIVRQSANGAVEDLLWGALLASVVIFIFFRDLRNTIITIAGLPVIMISSLFFMDLLNISLNQLSLLALALVIGLVIDDGIVVRENILRWIEKGYRPVVAASKGTAEVVLPVLATSATILAVFLPVAYAEGIIGQFFRDFGLTVSIAIVVSTFEALTMAPMLSSKFFRKSEDVGGEDEGEVDESRGEETAGRGPIDRLYAAILNWTLNHKAITALLAVAVIALSAYSASTINQAFIPSIDQNRFEVSMEMPVGTPLDNTYAEAEKVETIIRSHPGTTNVFTSVGGTGTPNRASFSVQVDENYSRDGTTVAVMEELREPLANVPGIAFQVADDITGGDNILGNRDIIIEMSTNAGEYRELGEESERFAARLSEIPGLVDIDVSYRSGTPELQLDIDRQRAANIGLSTAQIGSTVRTLINGEVASIFRGEGEEANIRVQLDEAGRGNAEDILNLGLLNPGGELVPLRTVADGTIAAGPNEIVHTDRRPTVSIGANVSGRDIADANADVIAAVDAYQVPDGMELRLAGEAEVQAESFRNLSLALLLAIVFIYMVLASQFESFVQPLIIMIAMPLAVIGALLALTITGNSLDLTAFIGFIMLMGLVTKNSILLVDFANRARANGETADAAMRIAGPVRLRPILMTAFSLILAMVPVALGLGSGGEFRAPMAIAIMGGMVTSTFLTLLIVPAAYSAIVGSLDRISARTKAGEAREATGRYARQEDRDDYREQVEVSSTGGIQPVGD